MRACVFSPTPTCFETPGYLTAGGRGNKRDMENREEEEVPREADASKIIYIRTEAGRKSRARWYERNVSEQQGMRSWWKQNRENEERRFRSQICFWKKQDLIVICYVYKGCCCGVLRYTGGKATVVRQANGF